MTDWLTAVPWGFYASGLFLIALFLYLANWYEDRVARARDTLERDELDR